ncbi:hypothetical protein [Phenylobacterium sp.]|uniref:hypothetical protein n=1 Tax=Phenylobacterium sp. TaxID=1871053 RepID=UPI0025E107F5|nr:hypothetical protein [Phenylobacterium sp.]MCA6269184.1 hypothetical protein [Phenylobacterium sp.]
MSDRMDYGKPGDPSGCYFPQEWRSPGAKIGHENREAVRQFFADHIKKAERKAKREERE